MATLASKTKTEQDYEDLLIEIERDEALLSKQELEDDDIIGLEQGEDAIKAPKENLFDAEDKELKKKATKEIQYAKRREKYAKERALKNAAFEQELVNLDTIIPEDILRLFIEKLCTTKDYSQRHLELAQALVKAMLYQSVPVNLRRMKELYPLVIKKHLGFLYTTTYCFPERKMWFACDIPHCFAPGEEMAIIKGFEGKKLKNLDLHIEQYYKGEEKKKRVKTAVAIKLVHNNVKTYMDLVRLDPLWWEVMYSVLKEKNKNERSSKRNSNSRL